uniref:receptor-like protein 33 n=1 Tax=Erigeron canadensis TaxID=72917 RepID=UPI001CB8EFA8|nr:receptor-like protein 33 [Erigeron canadensis]
MLSRLELGNCGLSGSIPDSTQNLTRLEYLDLAGNRLIGSIPSFKLSKSLVQVYLQQNKLTGEVPSSHWEGLNKLEFLNLASNSLSESFPESILTLKSLKGFDISNNSFSGQISNSINVSSFSQLDKIDMSRNKFHGPIPAFIFKLPLISNLVLSANNFNGSVDLDMFGRLKHLYSLELSYNDLKVNANTNGSAFSSLSRLNSLMLASCKMQEIPDVRNQPTLKMLDLSDNELTGEIPNWLWDAGNGALQFLNLSHNRFLSLQKPYTFPFELEVLDLHSNILEGDIPIPSRRVYFLDYSSNNFGSSIPADFGKALTLTLFFSISNSKLVGNIPQSLCNASRLDVLDLSNNSLTGTIPSCLAETTKTLRVLDVGRNNLTGNSLDVFPESCNLQTLDLSGNHFQGRLPQSLVNCEKLEVLNLGDNAITDTFPCWLRNLSNLHVFAVRSNKFYGNIDCLDFSGNWTNLQIIDIASNGFSGSLPPKFFASFQTNESKFSHLHFIHPANSAIYYQDSVTLILKGQTTEIVKILTIFTSIDFSNNNFQGNIPVTIGDLKWLKLLNLSHNALTGPVPQSMGKMGNLESLDLSVNELSGTIPQQLASLTFLSLLNLSDNQLSGRIPGGPQFQTFTEASFRGNQGLCGLPLTKVCNNATSNVPTASTQTNEDSDYETGLYVSIGLGFLVGLVIIVGPLVFLRRWRNWYSNHVDRILARIDNKHTGMVINNNEHQDSTF